MIKEHDTVVLTEDLPDEGLTAGDIGTIHGAQETGQLTQDSGQQIPEGHEFDGGCVRRQFTSNELDPSDELSWGRLGDFARQTGPLTLT